MKNKHDCFIGTMSYAPMFKSTIVDDLKFRYKQYKEFQKIKTKLGFEKHENNFSLKELVENLDTFIYCPFCGVEINWNPIYDRISKIKVAKKYK